MQERQDHNADRDGLPWAFVLDPAANARALGDIQRRGFEAARQLVDRIVPMVDDAWGPRPDHAGRKAHPDPAPAGDTLQELVRSWTELTVRVMVQLAEARGRPGRDDAGRTGGHTVSVDLSDDRHRARLRLRSDPSGRLSAAPELWLHNPSAQPLGPVRIAVDDLCTPAGQTLDGDRIRFEPSDIGEIAARSARGTVVTSPGAGPSSRAATGAVSGSRVYPTSSSPSGSTSATCRRDRCTTDGGGRRDDTAPGRPRGPSRHAGRRPRRRAPRLALPTRPVVSQSSGQRHPAGPLHGDVPGLRRLGRGLVPRRRIDRDAAQRLFGPR